MCYVRIMIVVAVGALLSSGSAAEGGSGPVIESVLVTAGRVGDDGVTALTFDPQRFEEMKSLDVFTLTGFPLGLDERVDLKLHRIELFADDATIVIGSETGERVMERPNVLLLAGQVVDRTDSYVFLGLSPHAQNGYLELGDEMFIISSGPVGGAKPTVIYSLADLPPGTIRWSPFECVVKRPPGLRWPDLDNGNESPHSAGDAPCRVAKIAIETDWEYTGDVFGGDTEASAAYAVTLWGAISEIYTRDVNTRLRIGFLRVWESNNDPYDRVNIGDFRNYWNANMRHIERNAAHLLSGRRGGGVAYFPGLCVPSFDYGLSYGMNGFFPYPLEHNHGQNWDPFVVSHELGHNFGAPHTHQMEPPVDNCGNGDCRNARQGTIMSYCHTCPGGMSNIRLEFHQQNINKNILPYLDRAPCDLTGDLECLGLTCESIKKLKAKCKRNGVIKGKVVLSGRGFDGAVLTVGVDGKEVKAEVNGKKAKFRSFFYDPGRYKVSIVDPPNCDITREVQCR